MRQPLPGARLGRPIRCISTVTVHTLEMTTRYPVLFIMHRTVEMYLTRVYRKATSALARRWYGLSERHTEARTLDGAVAGWSVRLCLWL